MCAKSQILVGAVDEGVCALSGQLLKREEELAQEVEDLKVLSQLSNPSTLNPNSYP